MIRAEVRPPLEIAHTHTVSQSRTENGTQAEGCWLCERDGQRDRPIGGKGRKQARAYLSENVEDDKSKANIARTHTLPRAHIGCCCFGKELKKKNTRKKEQSKVLPLAASFSSSRVREKNILTITHTHTRGLKKNRSSRAHIHTRERTTSTCNFCFILFPSPNPLQRSFSNCTFSLCFSLSFS